MPELADVISSMGIRCPISDGELVAGVVVLLKIIDPRDGGVILRQASSEAMSWIERYGMLQIAANSDLSEIVEEE
jgi:hypothetical protein